MHTENCENETKCPRRIVLKYATYELYGNGDVFFLLLSLLLSSDIKSVKNKIK